MTFTFKRITAMVMAALALQGVQQVTAQDSPRAATRTTLSVSPNPAFDDQEITLTATVQGSDANGDTPRGAVEFLDGTTSLGIAPIVIADSAVEAFTRVRLRRGAHPLTARFLGDARFEVSISGPVHLVVNGR